MFVQINPFLSYLYYVVYLNIILFSSLLLLIDTESRRMIRGDLWNVRESCKESDKWLIVNIQRDDNFECHKLNRDIWNDDSIQEIIR